MQEMLMKNYQLMHLVLIQIANESEEDNDKKELSEDEKKKKVNSELMNELLDEFDDDIDRIKSKAVPKSVKYSVYSFAFLVFLILWGSISEVDTTITASGKITTIVPNVEVQSNFDSVVKDIYVKKGQSIKKEMLFLHLIQHFKKLTK